jgi:hypothetical protein
MTIASPAVSAKGASDPCFAAHVNNFVRFSHVISIFYSGSWIGLTRGLQNVKESLIKEFVAEDSII